MSIAPRTNWSRLVSFCILHSAFCILIFTVLATHHLSLPGLHYDEAKEAGLNAMQLVSGQPVTAFRDATVAVGPWRLPLMVQDYIGALNVLLAMPFLAVGGVTVPALRALPVLIGALTLLVTWRVAWRLGGPVAAVITATLLAVNPSFIFWSRQGIFVTNLTALFFMTGLLTALRWWEGRRARDLWLFALLCGLGVYAKLLFVWAIGAMVMVGLGAWAVRRWRIGESANQRISESAHRHISSHLSFIIHRSSIATWLVTVICFLLPLVPLIAFNLQTGGTVASIFGNLGNSYYGVNNRAYLANLLTRLGQLRTLLRGDHLWYLGEVYANQPAPWLALGLLLIGVIARAWQIGKSANQRIGESANQRIGESANQQISKSANQQISHSPTLPLSLSPTLPLPLSPFLPVALLALVVAQSAFTVSDLFITHYALLLPLIPLSVGTLASSLLHAAAGLGKRWHSAFCLLISALVLFWGATDLANTVRYHRVLTIAGGYASHSDAIYGLASFLSLEGPSAPVALDWGIDAPVRFLTAGQANPIEIFGYERLDSPDSGFTERAERFIDNPDNVYVGHLGEFTVFRGRTEALAALATGRGMQLQEVARFGERSGRPLFVVYRARRAG
jgi:hypothetical protein